MRSTEHHRHVRVTRPLALLILATLTLVLPLSSQAGTPGPTLLAADDFERVVADGWSTDGEAGRYAYPAGTAGLFTDGSTGAIEVGPGGASREVWVDGVRRRDVDVRYRVTLADRPGTGGVWLTTIARHTIHGELRARLRFLGDGRVVAGVTRLRGTHLVNLGAPVQVRGVRVTAGTSFEVRVRVAGNDPTFVGMKVWPAGTPQPAAWLVARRDGGNQVASAGTVGLRARVPATATAGPLILHIDNLAVRTATVKRKPAPSATPRATPKPAPTLTPTAAPTPTDAATAEPAPEPTAEPTPEPTAEPTPEPTAEPTAEPTPEPTAEPTARPTPEPTPAGPLTLTQVGATVAEDHFQRVVDTGWGRPVTGDRYDVIGSAGDFSVDGDAGTLRLVKGATRAATTTVARARDVDLSFRVRVDRLPLGGSVYAYGIARRTAAGTEYRLKLRITSVGAVFIQATRRVDGREVSVGAETRVEGLVVQPGSELAVRARVTGSRPTVLKMKVWPAGVGQPKGWPYAETDSHPDLQSDGTVGLMAYAGSGIDNGPVTVAFDDLVATVADEDAVPATPDPATPDPATPDPATPDPETPAPTSTPTAVPVPTAPPDPTAAPTASPAPTASSAPTPAPTAPSTSTPTPTRAPTPVPTASPTSAPTASPTSAPTMTPTPTPTPVAMPTTTPDPSLTRFVATSGSDSNPGTAAAPWRTLQKAADGVPAGGLVIVRAGTYAGFVVRRSGIQGDPTIFRGDPSGAQPVLDGAIDARADVVRFSGVHDVRLENFEIIRSAGGNYAGSGVRTENQATRIAIVGNTIHDNRSYGILSHSSTAITIRDNDIFGNEQGIEIRYAGEGTRIVGNHIHDQDRMLRNTVGGNDDSGAAGIGFVKSTGAVLASGNRIHGNRAPSHDYTWDGGAFEIYGASNVTITENVVWDNENVLETGTDGVLACRGNTFTRNVAYGATTAGRSWGLFLRCGEGMLVANNTFVDLEGFVFSLGSDSRTYSGRIDGLRVLNNVIDVNGTGAKVYGLVTNLPASAVVDHNLVRTTGHVATLPDGRKTTSQATFTAWTGNDRHGIQAAPEFIDRAAREYGLSSGSPAVDAAMVVSGVSDVYAGSGPDMGALERLH